MDNSGGIDFEYFGVYYKEIMYYLSTDPKMNVVKHFIDEGKKNRVIKDSKIPNQHLLASITRKLQGYTFLHFGATYILETKLILIVILHHNMLVDFK